MGVQAFDEKAAISRYRELSDGDGTDFVVIFGYYNTTPVRIDAIYVTTDEASPITVDLGVTETPDTPATATRLGSGIVPAGSGNGTVLVANLLTLIYGVDFPGLFMSPQSAWCIRVPDGVTTGKKVTVLFQGGEL